MYHVLILGPEIKDKGFVERDKLRDNMVKYLDNLGIRFVEYHWIWNDNRIQLLVGSYNSLFDAKKWISFFIKRKGKGRVVEGMLV